MAHDTSNAHVLVFIDLVGDVGGAETLATQLLDRLDGTRFERTLVVYQRRAPHSRDHEGQARVVERLRGRGVRVLELERRNRWDLWSWRPFLRLLRSGTVDVLHSHKFGPNVWATLFARLVPVPVVVAHEHTWSYEGQPLRRLLDRWIVATGCDAFVAVSEQDRHRMIAIEGVSPGRARYVPNGIPTPAIGAQPDIRTELAIPPGGPIVGAIGVFRAQKDFVSLVRAFALVRASIPETHLVIVGDGPTRPEIELVVAELGLDASVRLTGLREDAVQLATAFDVATNSSVFEGASLAILEYMALGLPIVATAVGGTPDLLGDEAGVLVPAGDPAALAEAITALLRDPTRAHALGQRALDRQRREYDIDVQVRRLTDLYGELLDAASDRGDRRRRHRRRRLVSVVACRPR